MLPDTDPGKDDRARPDPRPRAEHGRDKFGLAFSVLVDALVIRSLLLPAVMHLIGPANWALPNWLGRVLPHLDIEQSHQDPGPRMEGIGAIGTS